MKHLGIDYGKKRIGIAISDIGGRLAFPHSVVNNDNNALGVIAKIIQAEQVGCVVVGESNDFTGQPNPIQNEIDKFTKQLTALGMDFEVKFEPEFLTSVQAVQVTGKNEKLDASAAALILQSYLDRRG